MNVYSEEVLSEKVGAIGFITLNRPESIERFVSCHGERTHPCITWL
jgi:hypothetical protein